MLITTDDYSAEFLIQHENIWQKQFKFAEFLKDKAQHKVVAHEVPTEVFNYFKDLQLLQQEIKLFNKIQLLAVNQLFSSQNRETKKHNSIVIAFNSEAAA